MDTQKIMDVLDIYIRRIDEYNKHGFLTKSERCDTGKVYPIYPDPMAVKLNHVWWACEQAKVFATEGRKEKAFRWLGFVQGALWMNGVYSIDDLANHNRPPSVPEASTTPAFDPAKILDGGRDK